MNELNTLAKKPIIEHRNVGTSQSQPQLQADKSKKVECESETKLPSIDGLTSELRIFWGFSTPKEADDFIKTSDSEEDLHEVTYDYPDDYSDDDPEIKSASGKSITER